MFPVREMHEKIAAGCGKAIEFDDEAKTISVSALIVDKSSAEKVRKGVLIGFSQGGDYVGTPTADPIFKGCTRYVADPREISVVDSPCLPQALIDQITEKTFQYAKQDGSVELRKFHISTPADPARMETLKKSATRKLAKGMYTVRELAGIIDSLKWLQSNVLDEAIYEGDNSTAPENLADLIRNAVTCFLQIAEEETTELLAGIASLGDKAMTPEQIKALEAKLQKSADTIAKAKTTMKALHGHLSKAVEMCKAVMGDDEETEKVDKPPVEKTAEDLALEKKKTDDDAAAAAELAKKTPKVRTDEEIQTLIAEGIAKALAKKTEDEGTSKVKLILAPRPGDELKKVAVVATDASDAKNAVGF